MQTSMISSGVLRFTDCLLKTNNVKKKKTPRKNTYKVSGYDSLLPFVFNIFTFLNNTLFYLYFFSFAYCDVQSNFVLPQIIPFCAFENECFLYFFYNFVFVAI